MSPKGSCAENLDQNGAPEKWSERHNSVLMDMVIHCSWSVVQLRDDDSLGEGTGLKENRPWKHALWTNPTPCFIPCPLWTNPTPFSILCPLWTNPTPCFILYPFIMRLFSHVPVTIMFCLNTSSQAWNWTVIDWSCWNGESKQASPPLGYMIHVVTANERKMANKRQVNKSKLLGKCSVLLNFI